MQSPIAQFTQVWGGAGGMSGQCALQFPKGAVATRENGQELAKRLAPAWSQRLQLTSGPKPAKSGVGLRLTTG